uniref:Uncharacterized protein n=1 Tax=Anopheles culicifacies TaxID=139723 RepID=A0A182MFA4_9DIPT
MTHPGYVSMSAPMIIIITFCVGVPTDTDVPMKKLDQGASSVQSQYRPYRVTQAWLWLLPNARKQSPPLDDYVRGNVRAGGSRLTNEVWEKRTQRSNGLHCLEIDHHIITIVLLKK